MGLGIPLSPALVPPSYPWEIAADWFPKQGKITLVSKIILIKNQLEERQKDLV